MQRHMVEEFGFDVSMLNHEMFSWFHLLQSSVLPYQKFKKNQKSNSVNIQLVRWHAFRSLFFHLSFLLKYS